MYKQSINHIQLVIVSLDGVIFDLNKYRYNYYRHLCDKKNIKLTKLEFYTQLSNMYDMYKKLPLSNNLDVGPLNSRIEREMMQYLDYKGIKPKEGFVELIEYLHQKEIPIAVISTHRTKDAIHYLKACHLYKKVHFIMGSDTTSHPLPSIHMLESVVDYFKVDSHNTLVLSSFMALNQAAQNLEMNIIYVEDLVEAGEYEKDTSYKVAHNIFEVLNILLFDKYEEAELYSPILGMNSRMDKQQLDETHDKLKETYQDDQQIIELVDQTYAYHISQLNDTKSDNVLESVEENHLEKDLQKRRFVFEDDDGQELPESRQAIHESKEDSNHKVEQPLHISTLDSAEEEQLNDLLRQINKPKPEKKVYVDKNYKIQEQELNDDPLDIEEDESEEEKNLPFGLGIILNTVYVMAISFIITFVGLIIAVVFANQFESQNIFFQTIHNIFIVYYSLIEMIFSTVFNLLHSLIPFVPDYQTFTLENSMFSSQGIQLLNIFIFQSLIIGIFKIAMYIYKRGKDYDIE